jgi:hypothetical protein
MSTSGCVTYTTRSTGSRSSYLLSSLVRRSYSHKNQSADCSQDSDRCVSNGRRALFLWYPQRTGCRHAHERLRSDPYPEGTPWSFSRFYVPQAFDAGYRLLDDASLLWQPFEAAHEIVLKESELKDAPGYCPEAALWTYAVHHCGYVQSRHATGRTLATA